MTEPARITLGLLVGGASRRMGAPKERLVNENGQTLLNFQLQRLSPHFEGVLLLTGARPPEEFDLPEGLIRLIQDPPEFREAGPLAGLLAALNASSTERLLLLGIDQPFFPWRLAYQVPPDREAVVWRDSQGRQQWLGGVFRRSLSSTVAKFLESGGRAFQAFLESLPDLVVKSTSAERAFLNINTPEQAEEAGFWPVPDSYPVEGPLQAQLSRFLLQGTAGEWRLPAAQTDVGRALLRRRRAVQKQGLFAALGRYHWQAGARSPAAVTYHFLLSDLVKGLLARKLPLEVEDQAALVALVCDPSGASEMGESVLRQLLWHRPLAEPVRDSLVRLRKIYEFLDEPEAVVRVEQLLKVENPEDRLWRNLFAHARRVPDKLSKRWRAKARALIRTVGEKQVQSRLLPWVQQRLEAMVREEPRLLAGLVCACGELRSDSVARWLVAVARWGYSPSQGEGPVAARMANLALDSLGRMATEHATRELTALEHELDYPSARQRVKRALRRVATYRSLSPVSVREIGSGDPSPTSKIGRRLYRAHRNRLEEALRARLVLPGQVWVQMAQESTLLADLYAKVIFQSENREALGCHALQAESAVWLWHPAEATPAERDNWQALLNRESIQQPFEQVERGVYDRPEHESGVLRQHQFAALARQRGWSYELIGRYRQRGEAALELGRTVVAVEVRQAPSASGPYDRHGSALRVVLQKPVLRSPLAHPRHLSEAVRDWYLFARVAQDSEAG